MATDTLAVRRALPVDAVPGEPDAYRRFRALNLADARNWIRFLWVIDAATTDPNLLTYAITVRGATLTLTASQVLPFVFGLAVGHGNARDAIYRDGLIAEDADRIGMLFINTVGDLLAVSVHLVGDEPGTLAYAIDACGLLLLPTADELGAMLHGITIARTGTVPARVLGPAIDEPAPAVPPQKGRRRK